MRIHDRNICACFHDENSDDGESDNGVDVDAGADTADPDDDWLFPQFGFALMGSLLFSAIG